MREQFVVVEFAGERRLMVLIGKNNIVQMAAKYAIPREPQPAGVIQQREVGLDLRMPEIVPVTEIRRTEPREQRQDFPLGGHVLVAFAVFDSHMHILFGREFQQRGQRGIESFEVRRGRFFPIQHVLQFSPRVFFREQLLFLHQTHQFPVHRQCPDPPAVDDDGFCADPRGEFDGFARQLDRPLPVAVAVRGKFITIRRIRHDLHRHRAKVMHARDLDIAALDELQDALQLRHPQTVPQLNVLKTKLNDFRYHFSAVGVTVGVPGSGAGEHERFIFVPCAAGGVKYSAFMKTRKLRETEIEVSEVGFGLWTVSTGWWGSYTDEEAVRLMREAADLGVTLFDAADTYGNGRSEELIAKAFAGERDRIVIATKVGYDFVNHGEERRGQREIPQDFSPAAIRRATDAALARLKTDVIDVLQLHNIRMEQVDDAAVWETLEDLRAEGKIRVGGAALGPAIGWMGEGVRAIREHNPGVLQHIYNFLEQHPGRTIQAAAEEAGARTQFLIRVPHSSGMLEGKYTEDTVFEPNDHRNHRPRSWLINGVRKVEQLRFLEREGRTMGQAAIQWLLADDRVASVLPNIYNSEQLREFAAASDAVELTSEERERMQALYDTNFGQEPEVGRYKGTMELPVKAIA